jgi:hypothetical protein
MVDNVNKWMGNYKKWWRGHMKENNEGRGGKELVYWCLH